MCFLLCPLPLLLPFSSSHHHPPTINTALGGGAALSLLAISTPANGTDDPEQVVLYRPNTAKSANVRVKGKKTKRRRGNRGRGNGGSQFVLERPKQVFFAEA
jgi:hypothetical protein